MTTTQKKKRKPPRKRCRKCGYKWYSRVKKPKRCPNCKRADWKKPIRTGKNHPNAAALEKRDRFVRKEPIKMDPEDLAFLYEKLVEAGMADTIKRETLAAMMIADPHIDWGAMIAETIEDNRGKDVNTYVWLAERTRR